MSPQRLEEISKLTLERVARDETSGADPLTQPWHIILELLQIMHPATSLGNPDSGDGAIRTRP